MSSESVPLNQDQLLYGCVFCMTGKEIEIAQRIEEDWPGVSARAVRVLKRRTKKGVKTTGFEVAIPGYVFFRAEEGFVPYGYPMRGWHLLRENDGGWRLYDRDEQFARWLFVHDGDIGMSKAYQVGDRVQIQQGPLKELEGFIRKIDKRNQSGKVEITVNGNTFQVWLGYELLESELSFPMKL